MLTSSSSKHHSFVQWVRLHPKIAILGTRNLPKFVLTARKTDKWRIGEEEAICLIQVRRAGNPISKGRMWHKVSFVWSCHHKDKNFPIIATTVTPALIFQQLPPISVHWRSHCCRFLQSWQYNIQTFSMNCPTTETRQRHTPTILHFDSSPNYG